MKFIYVLVYVHSESKTLETTILGIYKTKKEALAITTDEELEQNYDAKLNDEDSATSAFEIRKYRIGASIGDIVGPPRKGAIGKVSGKGAPDPYGLVYAPPRSTLYQAPDKLKEGVSESTLLKYFPLIKRGDVVHFGEGSYRNDGKQIFDGVKLIPLADDLDEYEHLPSEFTLNEFPGYDYFDKTIAHNNIRWLRVEGEDCLLDIDTLEVNEPNKYFIVATDYTNYKILLPNEYSNIKTVSKLYEKITESRWYKKYGAMPLERASSFWGKGDEYDNVYSIWVPGGKITYE